MFARAIAQIPFGWALCNGTGGTPDLTDQFIVNAKEDEDEIAKTNITGALTQSGGTKKHRHAIGSRVDRDTGIYKYITISYWTTWEWHYPPYYAVVYIMKV